MWVVRQARFWLAIVAEIVLLICLWRFDDWGYGGMPVKFVESAVLCGIAYFAAASAFARFPVGRWATIVFWSVAVLLRVVALPLEPGDDFWRYQWEGKIQNAGFNPYIVPPNDDRLAAVRVEYPHWSRINHKDYSAIYPPGIELIFRALSAVAAGKLIYKLLFAAADLGTGAILLRLVGGGERYRDAAWYAWNPLVIYSFAGAAHFDSLMILPMLLGILCFQQSNGASGSSEQTRWAMAGGVTMGVAISIKLVPVLLLPACVLALGKRAWTLGLSLGIPVLLSLPFGVPHVPIWKSLGQFIYVARVNDAFWWMVEDTFWPNPHQKNYSYNLVIILVVVLVVLVFLRDWRRGVFWSLGTALLLSPVLHPWYVTWILPLAAWRRVDAWQVLSVTIFAYYLFWDERLFALPWHAEPWLRAFIFLPPIVAALFGLRQKIPPNEPVGTQSR